MRLRKIAILILSFVIMFSEGVFANKESDYDFLSMLGILPNGMNESSSYDIAKREDLAVIMAKILDSGELEACDTLFSDVTADNLKSGYINYLYSLGIINGETESIFNPNGSVSIDNMSKMLVCAMGLRDMADMTAGGDYKKYAFDNGFFSSAVYSNQNALTNKEILSIIRNVIDFETDEYDFSIGNDGSITKVKSGKKASLLTNKMKISVYEGTIENIVSSSYKANVNVTRNKYNYNYKLVKENTLNAFGMSAWIDGYKYENVPSLIWVDKNDKIVYITPKNDIEVKYAYIKSINNDESENASYSSLYINKIKFTDNNKTYNTDTDFKVYYNGEMTNEPVKLTGKLSKIIIKDGNVCFIESWDFKNGGIITSVTPKAITYKNEDFQSAVIRNFNTIEKRVLISDCESMDISYLKTDMTFEYYKTDNEIIFNASERVVTEKLTAVGNEKMYIGNAEYDVKNSVYYSDDGENFNIDGYKDLLGINVKAYFYSDNKCGYVIAEDYTQLYKNKFIGAVSGYINGGLDESKIEVWRFEPVVEKKAYILKDKLKLNDNIYFEDMIANSKSVGGDGIYEFEVNQDDKIVSVSKANPLYGFGTGVVSIGSFPNDSMKCVTQGTNNLYFQSARIVSLFDDDNGFWAKEIAWSQLKNNQGTGTKMIFYGDGEDSEVRLCVLVGNTQNVYGKEAYYGIITNKKKVLDSNKEVAYSFTVMGKGGTDNFVLSEEKGKDIPENAFIVYRLDVLSGDEFKIVEKYDLTDDFENWDYEGALKKGIVRKIDKRAVFFDNDRVIFMNPNKNFLVKMSSSSDKNFEMIDVDEVDAGDTVVYYYQNDMSGTIVIKD